MENIIEVRPLEVKRWHGKTIREFTPSPVVLECFVDRKKRKYLTGLTEADRKRLEKITGYDLDDNFNPEIPHPFYSTQNGKVKLEYRTMRFDMENPVDEIKIKMLRCHPMVANSMSEYNEKKSGKALFVIYDEHEEIETKAKRAALKTEVFTMVSKMNLKTKRTVTQILLGKSMRNQSMDYVDVKLSDAIEEKGYEKALEVFKRNEEDNYNESLIIDAVDRNVIQKRGEGYYYMDEPMGTLYEAIKFLKEPKNNMIKGQIIDKIS